MSNYDIIPSDREISIRQTKDTLLEDFPCKEVPSDWLMMTCFYYWDLPRNKELAIRFKDFVDEYYHDFAFAANDQYL